MSGNPPSLFDVIARAIGPRKPLTVSDWSDANRKLSNKGSAEPGEWRTSRNPPLREPMDCLSARSGIQEVVLKFPIQFGKTEVAVNFVGYTMDHAPGPIMVCLPGEVSMDKWVAQKLNPLLEESEVVKRALTSVASRDSANKRTFKDFSGGQLYLEHAGSPQRLKSTSAKYLVVDEFDEFATTLKSGDDPAEMLDGRTSAFPSSYKRLKISTPGIKGLSRIDAAYDASDRRRYYVPCPHCDHEQPLEWAGFHWNDSLTEAWYACRDCHAVIHEHHKTAMITAGRWVAENPESKIRGYTINCLYYQIGLGPRWLTLAEMWIAAQGDPAKLKTFINERLAESWEDPAMRAVKFNIIAERAEPMPLRPVPSWVLAATAGIDTQDDRLPVHILGWGRGMVCWPIDYIELPGDPANEEVWTALVELLSRPVDRIDGAKFRIDASLQDMLGHRTEAVKAFVRSKRLRRHVAGFGAVANNAPPLGKGKLQEINWKGIYDKHGVHAYPIGTVAIKHMLYGWLSSDAEKAPDLRRVRFSDELDDRYFGGLTAETYNPTKNRFEKRRGAPRNEPLDTWTYAYAAALHPELRLNRWTKAQWDAREALLLAQIKNPETTPQSGVSREQTPQEGPGRRVPRGPTGKKPGSFVGRY